MNRLEEIKEVIKNFIYESEQVKMQISEIENKRTGLSQKRNEIKCDNYQCNVFEIDELGKEISQLGNESQKLQNKLDFKYNEIKRIVNLTIDNLITEEIRKVRKIEEEKKEIEEKILLQKEKNQKYELQKQEFYERFGRMPEVSENSLKEDELQAKQDALYKERIIEIEKNIVNTEEELVELASIKKDFKDKNWSNIIEKQDVEQEIQTEEEAIVLPLMSEEFQVEEMEPIEYLEVAAFEPIEKTELGEIDVESFNKTEEINENVEEKEVDEIEKLARAIVEEIAAEQTKDLNINNTFDEVTALKNEPAQEDVQASTENISILDIIAKVEDGEIVYKAQISNGEEIKVYPTLEATNILLNDREYREAINGLLFDYAIDEDKILDNSVINKIDPTVCEILERFSQKYNCDEGDLIYNYAMSFSQRNYDEIEYIIPITYNLSYLKYTNLSKKEKSVIKKICSNALENGYVDIIGTITAFDKIKYMLKRLFNINSIKALPDGKYE